MKIEYDPTHDVLNIEFLPKVEIKDSLELDGIIIDYSRDKKIVAIEILDASKRTTKDPMDLIDLAIVREKKKSATTWARKGHVPTIFTFRKKAKKSTRQVR
ncbi:MAG: DUF2283 domain-containing protein [Candidatus Brocadiales bacterium]|nr:DUF2283 domain-containing protein [Candidatus Brocadiales bacterium]